MKPESKFVLCVLAFCLAPAVFLSLFFIPAIVWITLFTIALGIVVLGGFIGALNA